MNSIHVGSITTSLGLADAWGWDHMGGWGWVMAFFGLITMLVLVALVVWLFGAAGQLPRRGAPAATALELLAARYARGEIDRDEYLERRRDLEG